MKVTFTAFDGKQFDTMDECMEYEDGIKVDVEGKEIEVMAYTEQVGILTFYKYGEESLQWEDCCQELPPVLFFKDVKTLQKYREKSNVPVIERIGDCESFTNYWFFDEENEEYVSYVVSNALLKERERKARSKRYKLDKVYTKMRQM